MLGIEDLAKYKFSGKVYTREIGEQLAIYDIRDKQFRYLNEVGRLIFEKIQEGDTLHSVSETLSKIFTDVPLTLLKEDISSFANDFVNSIKTIEQKYFHSFESTQERDSYKYTADYYIKNGMPLEVGIELTGYCNCACIHCYLPRAKFQWDKEQFKKIRDDLVKENAFFISLTGGEIFLNRDIWDILDISTRTFPTALLTNGTLFTEKKIKRLASYPLDCINISIYGNSEKTHDAITQLKGSYKRTMDTITSMKSHGMNIWGRYILMKNNEDDFEDFCESWKQKGLPYNVTYQIQNDYNNKIGVNDIRVDPNKIARWVAQGLLFPPKKKYCFAGITKCRVNHKGDFYTCELLPISKGNVHQEGFSALWNKGNMRKRPTDFGCPGLGYLEHGNFKETYTYTDKILEAMNG